jgi:hypothetical protein
MRDIPANGLRRSAFRLTEASLAVVALVFCLSALRADDDQAAKKHRRYRVDASRPSSKSPVAIAGFNTSLLAQLTWSGHRPITSRMR